MHTAHLHTFKSACFAASVQMLAEANRLNSPKLKALAMRFIQQDRAAIRRLASRVSL